MQQWPGAVDSCTQRRRSSGAGVVSRRRLGRWLGALTAILLLPAVLVPPGVVVAAVPADPDSATAFQQSHYGTGVAAGDSLRPPLRQLWAFTADTLPSYTVIAAGRVFVVANGHLYALDARTGQILWGPVDLGTDHYGNNGMLAYADGVIVASSSTGILRAFAADTGRRMWAAPGFGAPVITNGIVYASLDGVGSTGVGMAAWRLSSGALVWRETTQGIYGTFAVTSRSVFFTSTYATNHVVALNASTGALQWTSSDPGSHGPDAKIAEARGRVYVAGNNPFGAPILDAITGRTLGALGENEGTAVDGSTLVLWDVAQPGQLPLGVVAQTSAGRRLWSFNGDQSGITIPAIVANGVAYAGAQSGMVYALDELTGRVLWSANAGSPIHDTTVGPPYPLVGLSIGDGILTVPTSKGVVAYTSATP